MFGRGPQIKIEKKYFLTQRKSGRYLVKLAEEALSQYHLKAFFAHYKINQSFKTMFTITRFRHIEVLFHKFYYYWGKGNCSLEARYTEVPLPGYIFKILYSYFEKGCLKKCTRQSRKVLWVVLSSLFFKEI